MPKNPRIDAYIAKAQPFARPILAHIRAIVLGASREVTETLKWGHPTFVHHGNVCTTIEWLTEGKRRNWKYERR